MNNVPPFIVMSHYSSKTSVSHSTVVTSKVSKNIVGPTSSIFFSILNSGSHNGPES